MVRQLAGAWLCGSALMGTVAWGFLSAEGTTAVLVPVPVRAFAPAGTAICPGLPSCGPFALVAGMLLRPWRADRKSTRLNSSHITISYAVFCLKKKNKK